jgi:hypothetical protein
MSCPICYETYSAESPQLSARCLNLCKHVMCAGCISSNIFDSEFYCPECGEKYEGATFEDMSVSYESSSDSSSPTPDESKNSSILLNIPAASVSPVSSHLTPRLKCVFEGCQKRAAGKTDGLCLEHAPANKKRQSLAKETEIAESLKQTSLRHVSIDGTRFRVLDPLSATGGIFDPEVLIEKFTKQNRMEFGEAMTLIDSSKQIMTREPNVLELKAPLVIVGDIHGQFYDLVNLLTVSGRPVDKTYLFLGDYVDRGLFSCEVMLLLLALKVAHPDRFCMIVLIFLHNLIYVHLTEFG